MGQILDTQSLQSCIFYKFPQESTILFYFWGGGGQWRGSFTKMELLFLTLPSKKVGVDVFVE